MRHYVRRTVTSRRVRSETAGRIVMVWAVLTVTLAIWSALLAGPALQSFGDLFSRVSVIDSAVARATKLWQLPVAASTIALLRSIWRAGPSLNWSSVAWAGCCIVFSMLNGVAYGFSPLSAMAIGATLLVIASLGWAQLRRMT